VVIHGIGEQRPYETLGAFVQGLAREFGIGRGQLEHRLTPSAESVRSSIRMPLPGPVGRESVRTLDFYEFHWAGMVRGKIHLPQVLAWLVRTALNPLRFWSQQAAVLLAVRDPDESSRRRLLGRFLSEVGRAILFPLVAAVVAAPFFYAASQPHALLNAWAALKGVLGTARAMATVTGFVALLLLVLASLRGARGLLTELRTGGTSERASVRWWAYASVATAFGLLTVGFAVDRILDLQTLRLVGATIGVLRPLPIALPLLTLVAATVLGRILVAYLGDIALYTTADENSEYFRTRSEILSNATALVREICESGKYSAVYLAGHSLGSVIAYDTVNRYIRDVRAGTPPDTAAAGLARIRGLLTFGSPLDAVYYFFRAEVGPIEPVRAQILSSLHGFRKQPSGRLYDEFTLAPYVVPDLPECAWLNVWSRVDLVSRRLVFYKVDRQEHRLYPWNPLRAHLAYWNDRDFYRLVSRWL
jgi:hypothetical protein